MLHMLTCFNLGPSASIEGFSRALDEFTVHMQELGLVESTGPIGRRCRHPIMDTDDERDHEFYFTMTFRDRNQCDAAVGHIQGAAEPGQEIHKSVYGQIADPVFTCWEDV